MMRFHGRLLVGLDGWEPDVHLIRYASMVVRANSMPQLAESTTSTCGRFETIDSSRSPRHNTSPFPANTISEPEVRFLQLLPDATVATPSSTPWPRSELRAQIETHFTTLPAQIVIACDRFKGQVMQRLPSFAADFECDLLLLGDNYASRGRCANLVMEAPCSVWLVPTASAPVLRRVLVPIDFTGSSAVSLQSAIDLASRFRHATCFAMHVDSHVSRFDSGTADCLRRRELHSAYDRFVAGIDTRGVRVEPLIVNCPDISGAIARAANRHSTDLIVMTTRGRTPSSRWILDSLVQQTIQRCRVSVLVLKSPGRGIGLLQAIRERLARTPLPHFS